MTSHETAGPRPGLSGTARLVVAEAHTARSVGSGALDVLATPVMIALMEAAAVQCLDGLLPAGSTSLGIHVEVSHERASPLGANITATATIETAHERSIAFRIEAADELGPIGRGRHQRVIVATERFLDGIARRTVAARAQSGAG